MANLNKVMLIGNLTSTPEVKQTSKGMSYTTIGLAINREWKDQSGEKKKEVAFIDVDFLGKQAEVLGKFLQKGSPLYVEGRLKLDQWEQDGNKRSKLKVVGESFQFIGGNKQDNKSQNDDEVPW
jgi:single-strand DNA-binding protein